MMRSKVLTAVLFSLALATFSGNACASDSRSLDDQVRWEGGLYSPFSGSWLFADVQAKQIDRLLVVLTHIREGRRSEAIRLLEEDLLNDGKSFDRTVTELNNAEPPLLEPEKMARDRVREVARRLRMYEKSYFPLKQQAEKAIQPER